MKHTMRCPGVAEPLVITLPRYKQCGRRPANVSTLIFLVISSLFPEFRNVEETALPGNYCRLTYISFSYQLVRGHVQRAFIAACYLLRTGADTSDVLCEECPPYFVLAVSSPKSIDAGLPAVSVIKLVVCDTVNMSIMASQLLRRRQCISLRARAIYFRGLAIDQGTI